MTSKDIEQYIKKAETKKELEPFRKKYFEHVEKLYGMYKNLEAGKKWPEIPPTKKTMIMREEEEKEPTTLEEAEEEELTEEKEVIEEKKIKPQKSRGRSRKG